MRFDAADALTVDLARSRGVLGANRHEHSLYVALDAAVARPIITLRARAEDAASTAEPGAPVASLISSRWSLSNRADASCGFTVNVQGFGPGEMTWATLPGRGFRVTVERQGQKLSEQIQWADPKGTLALRLDESALEPLALRFDCHG